MTQRGKTVATSSEAATSLTFDTVVDLLTMLDGSSFPTRVEFRDGPLRLSVERGFPAQAAGVPTAPAPAASATAAPAPAAEPGPAAPQQSASAADADGPGVSVNASITGVFYRASSPDAAPFVEVGQKVDAEDVIGIVEVMKLMNTVRAGMSGTIVAICAENAELVEFGQPLVRIELGA